MNVRSETLVSQINLYINRLYATNTYLWHKIIVQLFYACSAILCVFRSIFLIILQFFIHYKQIILISSIIYHLLLQHVLPVFRQKVSVSAVMHMLTGVKAQEILLS